MRRLNGSTGIYSSGCWVPSKGSQIRAWWGHDPVAKKSDVAKEKTVGWPQNHHGLKLINVIDAHGVAVLDCSESIGCARLFKLNQSCEQKWHGKTCKTSNEAFGDFLTSVRSWFGIFSCTWTETLWHSTRRHWWCEFSGNLQNHHRNAFHFASGLDFNVWWVMASIHLVLIAWLYDVLFCKRPCISFAAFFCCDANCNRLQFLRVLWSRDCWWLGILFCSHMKRCLSGLVQWLEDLNISDWWNLCKSVRRCRCMRWAWWSSGRRSGSHILLTRIVWKWKAKLSNMEVQHIDTNIRTITRYTYKYLWDMYIFPSLWFDLYPNMKLCGWSVTGWWGSQMPCTARRLHA